MRFCAGVVLGLVLGCAISAGAKAFFFMSGADWPTMPSSFQSVYVAGVADVISETYEGSGAVAAVMKQAADCVQRMAPMRLSVFKDTANLGTAGDADESMSAAILEKLAHHCPK